MFLFNIFNVQMLGLPSTSFHYYQLAESKEICPFLRSTLAVCTTCMFGFALHANHSHHYPPIDICPSHFLLVTANFVGPYPGVQRDVWRGIKGNTVTDLALHKDYPNNPTERSVVPNFDAPNNEGDDYGSRMRGYFVAPYTGTYSFLLSGNDEAELFFSGSSREKDKDLFAVVRGTGHNQFSRYAMHS